MELWFTEKQTPNLGFSCRVNRTFHFEKTKYQHLALYETVQFGRMLVLDGAIQTTEMDEFTYHEMIVHPAMCTHPNPKKVAVIGGGDGGSIREVLKHASVEKAVLVEIDERVVELSKEYLPSLSGSLADPRAEVLVVDGIEHIGNTTNEYDVIIVDSTDPVGAAVGLFSREFYSACFKALTPQGLLVAQTESPFFNRELIKKSFSAMSAVFPITRLYLSNVPTYPGGMWSFTMGSKVYDPVEADPAARTPEGLKYYTPKLHKAAFELPAFVEELVRIG